MTKKLFCVKSGNRLLEATDGTKYHAKKVDAKAVRDNFQGERPEHPEIAKSWTYRVTLGPDHWRSHAK